MKIIKAIFSLSSLFLFYSAKAQSSLGDTTITKEELVSFEQCKSTLDENSIMLFTIKEILKKNSIEINYLKSENEKLTKLINTHNQALKNSQEKYKIEINN